MMRELNKHTHKHPFFLPVADSLLSWALPVFSLQIGAAVSELANKALESARRTEPNPAKCVNYIKGKICSKITV